MALRIGGAPLNRPTGTVDQWDRAMTAMLTEAVTYGKLDTKVKAQKAWFANPGNYDHPAWIDRKRIAMRTWHARNEAVRRMMDAAETIGRMQASLPAVSRDGLGALLGHELTPHLPQRLALTAAAMGTTDVFAIVAQWLRDEQAEEEREHD